MVLFGAVEAPELLVEADLVYDLLDGVVGDDGQSLPLELCLGW